MILRLYNDGISHPLPKLSLCGPELLTVVTNHKGGSFLLFLFFLLFFRAHYRFLTFLLRTHLAPCVFHNRYKRSADDHANTPGGSLICEAASALFGWNHTQSAEILPADCVQLPVLIFLHTIYSELIGIKIRERK